MALGLARGLRFGLVQHPQGAPEVYVEGTLTRYAPLARDVHGPRAILNAVERLIGSAEAERDTARRDLAIAQGQLRDYEARLGTGFTHAAYLEALTTLRNQLEAALASTAQDGAEGSLPSVGALVERLKALHAAHTLDAAPERAAPRPTATVAEAITTRIRQREPEPAATTIVHTAPGTPGALDASPAVTPVLGTARRTRRVPRRAVRVAAPPPGLPPNAGESPATVCAGARPEEPYGRRRVAPRGVTGTAPAGAQRWLVPDVEGGRVPGCWWAQPPTPPGCRCAPREVAWSFFRNGSGLKRSAPQARPCPCARFSWLDILLTSDPMAYGAPLLFFLLKGHAR